MNEVFQTEPFAGLRRTGSAAYKGKNKKENR